MIARPQEPPPHNIDIEQALLGAILINNEAGHRVADIVEPKHFYEPLHVTIYDVCRTMIRSGKLATPITIKSYLPPDVTIGPGGLPLAQYIARLAANALTIVNAPDFAREIVGLSDRRELLNIADDIAAEASAPAADTGPGDIAGFAIDRLDELATARNFTQSPRLTLGEAADNAVSRMGEVMARNGAIGGITTGLRTLDERTDGWHRGELIVIAGRPSMGKTGLGLSSALRTAVAGHNVLFFSLEMTAAALANRAISDMLFDHRSQSPIGYWDIQRGVCQDSGEAVAEAARDLREIPLIIEQQAALTVSQIAARARKHKRALDRQGKSLDAVFVDHIHIIAPSGRYSGNRTAEITEISGGLKALAKELNAPVVALAQLNRSVESRDGNRPQMSDLRDSGSIEQDADIIGLLFREEYYLQRASGGAPEDEDRRVARLAEVRNVLELIIAKQRNGPTGPLRLFFHCAANAARDLKEDWP